MAEVDFEFAPDFDDDSEESSWQWSGRDATIFLIDAAPEMFLQSSDDDESHFLKALRCAHSTVTRKIIGNDRDLSSIILFNTKETKNAIDFPNIYIMQGIDKPGAERILELEGFLEDKSSENAKRKFGSTHDASIQDVLWVCRNLFIACKSKLATRNVLMFTCVDDPHRGDDHKKRLALKGAKDLFEAGIELEVLPLGQDFNINAFYKELLSEGKEEDDQDSLSILADPAERFDDLLDRVRRYDHKQRTTGRVTFSISPGVEIGVKVFTSIRKTYKPSKANLYKATNEEVVRQKKEYLEDGELLMPSDFAKYQIYGNKKIKFSLDEIRSMSKVYEPGIEVLGFKPLSSFKPYFYIKPASFIYSDDDSIKGSTKVFACLLERCVARRICPVVRFQARQNSSVSWAFLLPQQEERDEKNCQLKPPGFHVCYLPFADDFRNIELENRVRATTEQVDAAKNIIKKLHFKYFPECFENPDIQTHWRNVEALALNRSYLEPVTDYTVPDNARIDKKAGALIEQFKDMVFSPQYNPEEAIKKRAHNSAAASAPTAKRPKPSAASMTVEEAAKENMVEKLNMDTLKQWLTSRGVRVSGKRKGQLVQDVYDELS